MPRQQPAMAAGETAEPLRANRVAVTITPLRPRVIYDIEQIVLHFGADAASEPASSAAESSAACARASGALGWKRFQELWSLMDFGAIFHTQRACGRVPAVAESREEYVSLLLAAVAKHLQPARHAGFGERLGALFTLFTMYLLQPCEPRVPIPVEEESLAPHSPPVCHTPFVTRRVFFVFSLHHARYACFQSHEQAEWPAFEQLAKEPSPNVVYIRIWIYMI